MNRFKTISISMWIGLWALLWIPTVVNAQIFSVKRNPLDAMASFGITAGYGGFLAYDPIPFEPDQYTSAFGGTYLSHGPDGSGTAYAWMVDPRQAGSVTSQVKVRYITVNGVTTYFGLFKTRGHEVSVAKTKTPDAPNDRNDGPVNIDINNTIKNPIPNPSAPIVPTIPSAGPETPPVPPSPVPEPEEYVMLLLGAGLVAVQVRRKQNRLRQAIN